MAGSGLHLVALSSSSLSGVPRPKKKKKEEQSRSPEAKFWSRDCEAGLLFPSSSCLLSLSSLLPSLPPHLSSHRPHLAQLLNCFSRATSSPSFPLLKISTYPKHTHILSFFPLSLVLYLTSLISGTQTNAPAANRSTSHTHSQTHIHINGLQSLCLVSILRSLDLISSSLKPDFAQTTLLQATHTSLPRLFLNSVLHQTNCPSLVSTSL